MKTIFIALTILMVEHCVAATPLPFEELLYKGQAIPFYNNSTNEEQQKFIDIAKNTRLAERMASIPQAMLRLKGNLGVGFESCNTANAFFDPKRSAIVICSELVSLMAKFAMSDRELASDRSKFASAIDGAIWGIYFHELAHAVIGINHVPITGREEDVADQFAVWFAIKFLDLNKQPIIAPTIWFYRQLASARNLTNLDQSALKRVLSDEHSLDEQRIYNLACWVFGTGLEGGLRTAQLAGLPEERAKRCAGEYASLNEGIRARFKKYFKKPF